MLKLRSEIKIKDSEKKISYDSKLIFIGSCFAENISSKMKDLRFRVEDNPHGIMYNPMSILKSIEEVIYETSYGDVDLMKVRDLYVSLNHHGRFSSTNKQEAIDRINESIKNSHQFIMKADFLFISFGSAWVYEFDEEIVGNCHKIPAFEFTERLLSQDEIVNAYKTLLEKLKLFNPKLEIIFTVSPIRYLKYGFHENQISKSTLHLAIHELTKEFSQCHYFPSYEIMMDDLRDYRFYKDDLTHISDQAVDYIFDLFQNCYMSKETIAICKKIKTLNKMQNHKILDASSEEAKKFLVKRSQLIDEIKNDFPELDLN